MRPTGKEGGGGLRPLGDHCIGLGLPSNRSQTRCTKGGNTEMLSRVDRPPLSPNSNSFLLDPVQPGLSRAKMGSQVVVSKAKDSRSLEQPFFDL